MFHKFGNICSRDNNRLAERIGPFKGLSRSTVQRRRRVQIAFHQKMLSSFQLSTCPAKLANSYHFHFKLEQRRIRFSLFNQEESCNLLCAVCLPAKTECNFISALDYHSSATRNRAVYFCGQWRKTTLAYGQICAKSVSVEIDVQTCKLICCTTGVHLLMKHETENNCGNWQNWIHV